MNQHVINWFEIPTSNFERAKKFYSSILGRELSVMEMGGPVRLAMLGQSGDKTSVSGALITGNGSVPSDKGTIVFLACGDNLSTILDKVLEAGGKIVSPKTAIPGGYGHYAKFSDTEGNHVALHSPN